MQRILIIGPCGAGKSTLARRLGSILDLPVIHLDRLNWEPGWTMAPADRFLARVLDAARGPRWIIDGNYGATLHLRLPLADTIIFLDLARWRCMSRVLRRVWTHAGKTRPDMGEGCPEKFDWEFIDFVWHWFETSRPRLLARLARASLDKRIITLRAPREVDTFVRERETSKNNLKQNAY